MHRPVLSLLTHLSCLPDIRLHMLANGEHPEDLPEIGALINPYTVGCSPKG